MSFAKFLSFFVSIAVPVRTGPVASYSHMPSVTPVISTDYSS